MSSQKCGEASPEDFRYVFLKGNHNEDGFYCLKDRIRVISRVDGGYKIEVSIAEGEVVAAPWSFNTPEPQVLYEKFGSDTKVAHHPVAASIEVGKATEVAFKNGQEEADKGLRRVDIAVYREQPMPGRSNRNSSVVRHEAVIRHSWFANAKAKVQSEIREQLVRLRESRRRW